MNKNAQFLLIIGLSFIVMNLGFGPLLKQEMAGINYGVVGDVNAAMASDAEVLILGSSRAKHHYNPAQLEEYFNKPVFNMGVNGQGIEFSRAMLQTYLESNELSRVIVDISPNVFLSPTDNSKLMSLIPLIDIYPHFKGMFDKGDIAIELVDWISLANYNSTLYDIVRDRLSKSAKSTYKGYEGLEGNMPASCDSADVPLDIHPFVDERKVQALKDIVALCNEASVELDVAVSPIFCATEDIEILISLIQEIEGSFHLHNFARAKGISGAQYQFKDYYHLNAKGSEEYTKLFIKDLIQWR